MASTSSPFEWAPPLKRRVIALHAAILVLAGFFWASGPWFGSNYRIELTESLTLAAIPGLPIRIISLILATRWTNRALARGAHRPARHFVRADVLITLTLGLAAMPTMLLAYSVFTPVAWTFLAPVVPLLTARYLRREGFLPLESTAGPGTEAASTLAPEGHSEGAAAAAHKAGRSADSTAA